MGRWVEQLEEQARLRLPEPVYRYLSQGAREGLSASEAVAAWERYRFLPSVLRDVTEVDCSTELLGATVSSPVAIAPTSLQRAVHPDGEMAMARAAAAGDALMVVAGDAGTTFEDLASTGVTWWLQIYVPSDRLVCRPVLDRAVAAGASAIVLTADSPVVGTTYDDGGSVSVQIEPGWQHANFPAGYGGRPGHEKAADLGPQDIDWLRKATGLPVVVKGVLRAADARRCVDAGADAVWVSNHGGRQLDRAAATAGCLEAVVAEVGGEAEVYVDGGVRDGLHAMVALALGARAVFLGRAPLYALALEGQEGVSRLLDSLVQELVETMRLAGCNHLEMVSRDLVVPA